VQRGYIKGIIGLPANLFFGTSIPACIVVLDKEHSSARKGIFMIDASKGFIKDGNKNRLRAQDIHKIVDAFTKQTEIPKFSRMVPLAEISDPKNEYSLNIPRYIDSTEPEDLQDIEGHLRGGIPNNDIDALERYWTVFPSVRAQLFESTGHRGYWRLRLPVTDVKTAIFGHPEFTMFNESVTALFGKWQKGTRECLKSISTTTHPKALLGELSESLLTAFRKTPLVDSYDVYQHLMTYWEETMQDDVYMIVSNGWKDAAKPKRIIEGKAGKKETPDFAIGKQRFKAELIPAALLIARYFESEQEKIETIQAELASLEQDLDEMKDEHGNEGGLLEEVVEGEGDKRKITAKAVKARIKEISEQDEADDERKALNDYAALLEKQADTKSRLKATEDELEQKVASKYSKLSEDEIKTLVVGDKWLARLAAGLQSELDRVSQSLTSRVRQLAERYAAPLPELLRNIASLSARVDEHLKKMGAEC